MNLLEMHGKLEISPFAMFLLQNDARTTAGCSLLLLKLEECIFALPFTHGPVFIAPALLIGRTIEQALLGWLNVTYATSS